MYSKKSKLSPQDIKLREVRLRTARSQGSLDKIRSDLHKLGVKTTSHVTATRAINVFDDRWVKVDKKSLTVSNTPESVHVTPKMPFSRLVIQLNLKHLNLSSWLEYSKNGDSLVFDLGKASEDKVLSKKHTTLVCEVYN